MAIAPIALLTACTSSSPYVPTPAETSAAARSVDALNAQPNADPYATTVPVRSAYQPNKAPTYNRAPVVSDRISTNDTLDVNVFKVPDLSAKNLTVESSGAISLPLVGTIQVAGLTIAQAEQKITQRLTEFMQAPQPLAQGLTEVGNSRGVFFYRDGTRHLVNLDLVRNGTISDPLLRGDDRIVVMKDSAKVREKKVLDYLPAVTAPFSILRGLNAIRIKELADINAIAQHPGFEDATPDMVEAILKEAGKLASLVIEPLNTIGDEQGSRLENGVVVNPDGFKKPTSNL
ncbi:3-methylmercaptopropionyl-CoA dehydrogenase [Nymphon striatum]|nr:3-methylmercaptopropionyl-CoA dehydrogenase [Nymphon striatum]